MNEHAIQLRRAWEADVEGRPIRLDLPIIWGEAPRPRRLIRRFNRPPVDPDLERVLLRIESCDGLRGLTLNGRPIGPFEGISGHWELAYDQLSARGNCLELTLEPTDLPRDRQWGQIALVIRPR